MSAKATTSGNPKHRHQRGDEVELTIDSLSYGGRGVGRLDGYVVFVPYAAPGERVRARLTKRKSGFAEADLVEVITSSPARIPAPCNLFMRCGGCWWQHLPVSEQERAKEQIVRDALRPISGHDLTGVVFEPIVSSPDSFGYRNKMEFTFGQESPDAPLKLGFHLPSNWKHVLDVQKCWLMPEPLNALLEAARREGTRQKLAAWNPTRHEGMLRQLLIRWSVYEQKALVAILTGERTGFDFKAFCDAIRAACPQAKGILWGINAGRSDVARADQIVDSWGETTLEEHLGDQRFRISLASFFQTNTRGAMELYRVAREYLGLTGRESVFDAYCGTGTIGIFCAPLAKSVYGIDIVRDAIHDARLNASENGLSNCTFLAGDMAEALPHLVNSIEGFIDRLVVDPPRSGMEKKALDRLLELKAPVMVYVSCNPSTMARDLQQILDSGYRLDRLRPVDMFPQTYHVECVARCVRCDE